MRHNRNVIVSQYNGVKSPRSTLTADLLFPEFLVTASIRTLRLIDIPATLSSEGKAIRASSATVLLLVYVGYTSHGAFVV
jgi:hypothetical protein